MRFGIVLLTLFAACGGEPDVAGARTRAEAAVGELMETLLVELTTALRKAPPHQAIDICADKLPSVARRIERKHKLTVRRFAFRRRNPDNEPDAYEKKWFEEALKRYDGGKGPAPKPTAEVVDGELRYIRPILLAEMCTKCHGTPDQITKEVRTTLARRYPNDKATGYKPGDLRGAVSVRVPLD